MGTPTPIRMMKDQKRLTAMADMIDPSYQRCWT
jgi:hypothetical protein